MYQWNHQISTNLGKRTLFSERKMNDVGKSREYLTDRKIQLCKGETINKCIKNLYYNYQKHYKSNG